MCVGGAAPMGSGFPGQQMGGGMPGANGGNMMMMNPMGGFPQQQQQQPQQFQQFQQQQQANQGGLNQPFVNLGGGGKNPFF